MTGVSKLRGKGKSLMLAILVGVGLQVLGRVLVGFQLALSPALDRAVLNTVESPFGVITWLSSTMAFMMALVQSLLVKRKLNDLLARFLGLVLPAALVAIVLVVLRSPLVPLQAAAVTALLCVLASALPALFGWKSLRKK